MTDNPQPIRLTEHLDLDDPDVFEAAADEVLSKAGDGVVALFFRDGPKGRETFRRLVAGEMAIQVKFEQRTQKVWVEAVRPAPALHDLN